MFRAITDHYGPLKEDDPNYNGSLYNVMVEWETGKITEEPLSIIAKDDPVTCAAYTKEYNILYLPEWKLLERSKVKLCSSLSSEQVANQ